MRQATGYCLEHLHIGNTRHKTYQMRHKHTHRVATTETRLVTDNHLIVRSLRHKAIRGCMMGLISHLL